MNSITLEDVLAWDPCLTREEILERTGGRKTLTLLEIADLETATAEERLWVLLRPEVFPAAVLWELTCAFAEHSLLLEREAGQEPDPRSWAAIETRRRWLRGEASDEELAAAYTAADTAAWANLAARAAAFSAASTTDDTTAEDAAVRAASWAVERAARANAWTDAARAAANAEREWQLERIREALLAQGSAS